MVGGWLARRSVAELGQGRKRTEANARDADTLPLDSVPRMRWTVALASVALAALPASFATRIATPVVRRQVAVVANATSTPRQAFGLKTDGTTVTDSGISVGFHLDWNAGDHPDVLNSRLGKPAAIIGGPSAPVP